MRGRVVRFPALPGLRPTPDRVRETLFNWLGQQLSGRRCLELYTGSGALSLEAASRGAALAVANDRNPALVEALRANARLLGADSVEAVVGDARRLLAEERRQFDVIFLDPPFDDDPWVWLLPACLARLAPEGRIFAEASRWLDPPPGLRLSRRDRAGRVHYHLFAPDASPPR